jgi:tRNA (guanine-N7-)-methyltransferase
VESVDGGEHMPAVSLGLSGAEASKELFVSAVLLRRFLFYCMESCREPRKRFHRQRAHCNPFSDHNLEYPLSPECFDLEEHFEAKSPVEMVDVGCGYGGLLFKVSQIYMDSNVLGMEIRKKLVEYVKLKIHARRVNEGTCRNISVVRTNAMKFIQNYIEKGAVKKMFILFPDPQFKKKKQKGRIVSKQMLDIYRYLLKEDGRVYISTDVQELFEYMVGCFEKHPLFARVPETEAMEDPLFDVIIEETEESRKADMKGGSKHRAIFVSVMQSNGSEKGSG